MINKFLRYQLKLKVYLIIFTSNYQQNKFQSIFNKKLLIDCGMIDIKTREAIAKAAKQVPMPKKPDPLSLICAQRIKQVKKARMILKRAKYHKSKKQRRQRRQHKKRNLLQVQSKSDVINQYQNKRQRTKNQDMKNSNNWIKYLPNQCDEFGQNQQSHNNNKTGQTFTQNPNELGQRNNNKQYSSLIQSLSRLEEFKSNKPQIKQSLNKVEFSQFYYQMLKSKLGITQVKEQVKVKIQEKKEVQILKDSPNAALLPFAGRKFQQAPPKPQPKKIYQYAPTCKVAGLYQWPPPQSQFRRWKSQMKQSRKLN